MATRVPALIQLSDPRVAAQLVNNNEAEEAVRLKCAQNHNRLRNKGQYMTWFIAITCNVLRYPTSSYKQLFSTVPQVQFICHGCCSAKFVNVIVVQSKVVKILKQRLIDLHCVTALCNKISAIVVDLNENENTLFGLFQTQETSAKTTSGRCCRGHLDK